MKESRYFQLFFWKSERDKKNGLCKMAIFLPEH